MSDELLTIATRVADQARPGEQVEAYVVRQRETSVRVYEGEVEHLVSAESEGVGVRVIRDGRTGFAYAGSLDPAAVAEALDEARENVAFGTPDPYAGLPEPDGVPVTPLPLWSDDLAALPTDRKVALALDLERRTAALDRRVTVAEADFDDVHAEAAVASSTGIRAAGRENACYVYVDVLATEGDETQTGFGFSVGRRPDDLDLDEAAGAAVTRATRLLGAVKPASGRVTVVFDPFVTAQFLGVLSTALNGEAVLKGRSFFADRVGDTVAAPVVTLVDDPTDVRAFGATEVDAEGLAARRNLLIDGGVLRGFVHSSYSGRRSGTASTGNARRGSFKTSPSCGTFALALTPGRRSQAELVADVDDGVLVQMVQGLHSGVNPVSGDFSTGASGLRIRGGQLAEPLREFTIASTIQRMLLDIAEVGGDVAWLPMGAAGVSLVVRDVTMSGA